MSSVQQTSLRARGLQWSPSGDYIIVVDYESRSCAQISVLRLEGGAAALALREAARLHARADRRSALDSLLCETTLMAFSITELHDTLLVVYSLHSRWPDSSNAATCALWTIPIAQLQPRRRSALDTLCRLCGLKRVGRVQYLSQHIDKALSQLAHVSLSRLCDLSLSPDGRHLVASANLKVVLLIDLWQLKQTHTSTVANAVKIVHNDSNPSYSASFVWSPDGALFAMASEWLTRDFLLLGGS